VSLLLPAKDRRAWTCKALLALFTVGNFPFGIVAEFRIFLEIAPVSLLVLAPRPGSGASSLARLAAAPLHLSRGTHDDRVPVRTGRARTVPTREARG
jgi:hypothetical protein